MKKHNLDPAYGDDGVNRTGLVLSMGEVPDPIPLDPNDIEWPAGYKPHPGVHQMDLTQDYDLPTKEAAA